MSSSSLSIKSSVRHFSARCRTLAIAALGINHRFRGSAFEDLRLHPSSGSRQGTRKTNPVTKVRLILLALLVVICVWVMAYPADAATPRAMKSPVTVAYKTWTPSEALSSWDSPLGV
jgi:hypothetical protein